MLSADANPFVAFPGRVPAAFGGRGRVLADARTVLGRLRARRNAGEHILEGLRGVGKTALMAHVRHLAEQDGIVTVALELRHDPAPVAAALVDVLEELLPGARWRTVAARFRGLKVGPVAGEFAGPDPTPGGIPELVAEVAAAAGASDRPLLVTLDEAHESPELACQVIRGMHVSGQRNDPVATYIAGLPGTHARLAEVTTYAERLPVTDLGLLDHDGVRTAVAAPCRELDVEVADAVIDVVADESRGYPYFVQVWGHHLWDVAAAGHDAIGHECVDEARVQVAATTDRMFAGRNDRLTPLQRDYMHALARLGGRAESSQVAAALDRTVTQASTMRAQLIDRGMIYSPTYGTVQVTVPGFAEWLQQLPRP